MRSSILLFDDDEPCRAAIKKNLASIGGKDVEIVTFDDSTAPDRNKPYEVAIEDQIRNLLRSTRVGLIACDKELGLYDKYPGLSANAVSAVSRIIGLPFCMYSRHVKPDSPEFEQYVALREWSSDEITLDAEDESGRAQEIFELWRGFEEIFTQYDKKHALADALALIMGRKQYSSRVSLYGSGDRSITAEVFGFGKDEPHRVARVLGNWLRLSILRFPGLLVDAVAAASYLNISEDDFKRKDVVSHFDSSRYSGPFSGLKKWWWRDDLDSLLLEASVQDGFEYLDEIGVAHAKQCLDEQTEKPAGFYCMISQRPVGRENSRGNINWFPSGADLARIRNSEFDKINALVNV